MRTSTPSRHWRRLFGAAGAALLALVGASPAVADPPVHDTGLFSFVVEDAGAECGFPIRWEISGEFRDTLFFDEQDRLARTIAHTRETNTLTNLATGKTITDEPKFNQIVHFTPTGPTTVRITSVETMGLFVNARAGAGANVMDVGKVIIDRPTPAQRVLVFDAGQHPFRAETLTTLQAGLSAFCDVLA